jgi:hypothetical protein
LANKVVEPKYPNRKTHSKLDDYAAKQTLWLKTEAGKGRSSGSITTSPTVQHHCHIESGNDSYRFRNSSTQSGKEGKNKNYHNRKFRDNSQIKIQCKPWADLHQPTVRPPLCAR